MNGEEDHGVVSDGDGGDGHQVPDRADSSERVSEGLPVNRPQVIYN
jgi:hypothetical protein